jgi:hypothetical protein
MGEHVQNHRSGSVSDSRAPLQQRSRRWCGTCFGSNVLRYAEAGLVTTNIPTIQCS